ncbi:MAG: transposase family protein [Gammaproteobacteria bacterium]|nr:transposase family protein [Gammaproteobacteria bacterium]
MSENAFGILSQRWRVLRKMLETDTESAEKIVLCCVALHNWLRNTDPVGPYCPVGFADATTNNGTITEGHWRQENNGSDNTSQIPFQGNRNPARKAIEIREILTDFFVGEGSVSWQNNAICDGVIH